MTVTRVLYYVQHLLGVGHVFRAARIVSALVEHGFSVDLVYGGEKLPDFDPGGAQVHYLPSLVSQKGDFSVLIGQDGIPADDAYKANRRTRLLTIFQESRPDVLVTEAFPFGRRQMHFELLPLMEAASALPDRPLIFASIRDILQTGNKASKDRQTVDLVDRFFDGVLVHGDPDLIRVEDTFPFATEIAQKLFYTGIVTPQATGPAPEHFDVVVSAGGGLLGRELVLAAVEAKPKSEFSDARWCVLAGPYLDDADYQRLEQTAGDGVTIRRFIPHLCQTLTGASLSISLAGYNTVADLMAAGCRAIVAPQWNDKETEQLQRAQLLANRGLVEMIGHEDKNPDTILRAIENVMARPAPDWTGVRQQGGATTGEILRKALAGGALRAYN